MMNGSQRRGIGWHSQLCKSSAARAMWFGCRRTRRQEYPSDVPWNTNQNGEKRCDNFIIVTSIWRYGFEAEELYKDSGCFLKFPSVKLGAILDGSGVVSRSTSSPHLSPSVLFTVYTNEACRSFYPYIFVISWPSNISIYVFWNLSVYSNVYF